ncbi:alanine/ornithine racemase family PLP-dependent enzyme [Alkalicoccus saliphilus]|uniref:Alanine racemase n=1 Tax=Alkalicoccus saliphilus TaxID=200989 RepID=A0A2T4U3L0_9BACI|nr:alanine/ornithine racemase family PLP-dependent enzyme [Alkalicoccus saliphilus]PTL37976.1 alanine racemase [Alkalicoccus saliphilus]
MIHLSAPRVEVDLSKVAYNAERVVQLYHSKGIQIMGVTKGAGGSPEVAGVFLNAGIKMLADTKVKNLADMQKAGIKAEFVLLRTPGLSEVEAVVKTADISMNTELSVLKALSKVSLKQGKIHRVVLMVEMGDLREGIMPEDLEDFIRETLAFKGIQIIGIGANFACFGGIRPTGEKMMELSRLADRMEALFSLHFTCITGGNSGSYQWFMETRDTGRINNLRIGESILLGCETLDRNEIPGLYNDAFILIAEVIEVKTKPSRPYGEAGQNVDGEYTDFKDQGLMQRAILAVGSQDVLAGGLRPVIDIDILGSSGDHLIVNAKEEPLQVGDEVTFRLNYSALLSLMTSSYIFKNYIISKKSHLKILPSG